VRKTTKYKRKPTPEQVQALAFVARRCRELLRRVAGTQRGLAQVRRECHCRAAKRPTPSDHRGATGTPRHPFSSLAGRAHSAPQSLPAVFYPREIGRDAGLPPVFTAPTATPVSPTSSSVSMVARDWITVARSSPRPGASRCAGRVRWKAHPRQLRSVGKGTGGTSAFPARMRQYKFCL
jgi:hypothetical protein